MMGRTMLCAAALAVSLAMPGVAKAASVVDSFTSLWVLGDSLSLSLSLSLSVNGNLCARTGNTVPASPPYDNGRFSNGPVWNEPILDEFEAASEPAGNFAEGGATAVADGDFDEDLPMQLTGLGARQGDFGDRPLVSLWFGANELFDTIGIADANARAIEAADAIGDAFGTLSGLGVSDILLFTLPDLGRIPSYALFQPTLAADASEATAIFNDRLFERIGSLDPGLTFHIVDAFRLFNQLLADPNAFGVSEVTVPCVFPSAEIAELFMQPQVCDSDTGNDRAFLDSVHPNATIQAALSDQAVAAAVPLPAGAPLLLTGLVLLGARRLRRAA
ncbi:MAG: SGNH/GDSL hydrolase family protein [Pseudomonadota bacterium]